MSRKSIFTLLLSAAGLTAVLLVIRAAEATDDESNDAERFAQNEAFADFAYAIGYVIPTTPAAPTTPPLRGDLNADDQIDQTDFDLFRPCQTDDQGDAIGDCTESQKLAADLNADGQVDIKDFRRLLKRQHQAQLNSAE